MPGCEHAGTYIWVHGPSYETQAEIRAFRVLEGSCVGMSTAPEMARCRELGIRTGVISCITNTCGSAIPLRHKDVVDAAAQASHKVRAVIRAALARFEWA